MSRPTQRLNPTSGSRRRRGCVVAIIATILAVLASSCGIPTDDQARPVRDASEQLNETGDPTEAAASEGAYPVTLYFFDSDNNLYAVEQRFADPPTVNDILNALVANPPEELESLIQDGQIDGNSEPVPKLITRLVEEMKPQDGGYNSAINQQAVNVSSEAKLQELEPGRLTRIFTQIVCTLAQSDFDIESVSVVEYDDGESKKPIFAQNSSGSTDNDASERADYACDEAIVLLESPTRSDVRTKRALEQEE